VVETFINSLSPQVLEKIQTLNLDVRSENCHDAINELLQKTVLKGGKRLRPLLTYLMADLFGVSLDKTTPYAESIEKVHAASLAHDDVIDGATVRRGLPSINIEGSNKKAILAGDYLLANVIVQLTNEGNLKLVQEMAKVIEELALGEWLQWDASRGREYSEQIIEEIALHKTSSVMRYCCVAPAILAELPDALVNYTKKFGEHLGLAFQLIDDTLDFSQNSKKDQGIDLHNGQVNMVIYEWLKMNPDYLAEYKSGTSLQAIWTQRAPCYLKDAISNVKQMAKKHLEKSKEYLEILQAELPTDQKESFDKGLPHIQKIIAFLELRNH
jgi:geranylgeranyl pyrophosphate synthase